jgi:His-Xaa-Ser system protein HxsD
MKIKLDTNIYSLDAIKRTLYFLAPQAFIEKVNEQDIMITTENNIDENLLKRNLLDMQLQLDLEKEFLPIRNMLVAQALEPYQEIDNLLVLDNHE